MLVEELNEWDDGAKDGVGFEFILSSKTGGLVEHVFQVKDGKCSGFFGRGKVLFKLEFGCMYNEVNAAFDGNAKLPKGEEQFGNFRGEGKCNVFSYESAPCSTHTNGAELVWVVRVFVEGHEPVG